MHNNNTTLRSSIIMRLRARRMHSKHNTRNLHTTVALIASMVKLYSTSRVLIFNTSEDARTVVLFIL